MSHATAAPAAAAAAAAEDIVNEPKTRERKDANKLDQMCTILQ